MLYKLVKANITDNILRPYNFFNCSKTELLNQLKNRPDIYREFLGIFTNNYKKSLNITSHHKWYESEYISLYEMDWIDGDTLDMIFHKNKEYFINLLSFLLNHYTFVYPF